VIRYTPLKSRLRIAGGRQNCLPYLLLLASAAFAQEQHVAWSLAVDPAAAAPGSRVLLRMTGKIDEGWHLYSMSTPATMPTRVQVTGPMIDSVRPLQPKPIVTRDPNFNADTESYEKEVTFLFDVALRKDAAPGPGEIDVAARYQVCDPKSCVPSKWSGKANINIDPAAAAAAPVIPAGYSEPKPVPDTTPAAPSEDLASYLAVAFGFGLASIFTPCVFPMIPITMSYFVNKKGGVMQAVIFCLGIIVLFSGIGLVVRLALGPFGIVALGSSPWVNGFIALLFIAFGLSLLGAFEITIPSAILTKLNQGADKGGVIGSLLMGLTFSLASFACVGPFVGTLLAGSVSAGAARPLIGMVTFATGLALPFFLLALFPGYLQRMPRAGGWMARVKVVMAFIILAFSLKYLSSVDQVLQTNWLTRERFLAAWVVLFALPGLYLLGFLRLEGIKKDDNLGLGRLLTGAAFLIFALSLLPGMFGGKLGDLDAYVPEARAEAGGVAGASQTGLVWLKNQYREALAQARAQGKLVFVNFTGYACTNCHWMKANMFTRPEIAAALKNFVLVDLYTDGTDAASDENQKLELSLFKTVAIPFYAIINPDGNPVATYPTRTGDAAEYLAFLQKGARPAAPAAPATGAAAAPAAQTSALPQPKTLEGAPLDLAPYTGKVVVVDFWATWCLPCIKEFPTFNRLQRDYGAKGVAVIGIAMDEEGAERVKPFLAKHKFDYPIALGPAEFNQTYKLDLLPVTLVFDRAGNQVARFEGGTDEADIFAAVKKAL
jgi:thiol:disulfide interchange protein DsbD